MLGNDVYGDTQFDGTIYEFRIWNGAVSPVYVAVSAAAGPSVVVTNLTPLVGHRHGHQHEHDWRSNPASHRQLEILRTASGVTVTGGATNWTSSDTNVLSVNSSGLITALSGGTATVSATVDGVTATSATITVATTRQRLPGPAESDRGCGRYGDLYRRRLSAEV